MIETLINLPIEKQVEIIKKLQENNRKEEDSVIVLSQERCPKCVQLKMFLKQALRIEYEEVTLGGNEELFLNYVKQFNIQSTPALIKGDKCLVGFSPTKVEAFVKE